MARGWASLVCLACLAGGPARGGSPVKVEICPNAKGLSAQDTSRVMGELLAIGRPYGVGLAPQGCCADPACLRLAAFERKVTGLVVIELLRFGPMVRINLRAMDTNASASVLQLKSSAASKGFPASAKQLRADVTRALIALGASKSVVTTRPKPKPEPDPTVALNPDPRPDPRPERLPGPIISDADAAAIVSRRSTLNWTGGSLMAGGGVMLAVGIGLLAGPFQTAMDERDLAHAAWMSTSDPVLRDGYYREMKDYDADAKTYHTVGWIGVGLGAGMAVAGLVTFLLAPELPEDAPLARVGARVRPIIGPDGGGASLSLSW